MPQQETTDQTGLPDLPIYMKSAQAEAAQANFSIDDYGYLGDNRPYQVVRPAYPAPEFLQRFSNLEEALQECKTLCHLQGKPFRVVRWGRTGSGARTGGVPCAPCKNKPRISRFPKLYDSGCLNGLEDATPIAELHPDGRRIVYDCNGKPKIVGATQYRISRVPFPREHEFSTLPQRYLTAVKSAQLLAKRSGRRAYICTSFGASCKKRNKNLWVPVVYVQPGGLRERYDNVPTGTVTVTPVSPSYFKELLAQSRGASYLGQGH